VLSYLQNGPLDLFSDCFYESRKEAIVARLEWIRTVPEEVRYGLEASLSNAYTCFEDLLRLLVSLYCLATC